MTDHVAPTPKQPLRTAFAWLKSEPAVLILIAGIITLAIIAPQQLGPSMAFTAKSLIEMAPYFIIAVGFAAYAKASGMDGLVAKAFSGSPVVAIMIAGAAGALSPFCSCGVIPLIAAMLGAGVPLAPVMAFIYTMSAKVRALSQKVSCKRLIRGKR